MISTAERNFESQLKGIHKESETVPLKVVVRLNPLELGIYYKKNKKSAKKNLYLVELKNLILLENSQKITEMIFKQHPKIFDKKKVSFQQIYNIINKMLEYIKNELVDENNENGEDESDNDFNK